MTEEGEIRAEPLAVGDRAPDFALPAIATNGEEFEVRLSEETRLGPVMLLFYEDDGMPICTRQLNAFAQEYELLAEAGYRVFGMNTNGVGSHQRFQERDAYPFALISDFYGEAVKAYGMWDSDEKKSRRGVVVVGSDGVVRYVLPHFNPGNVVGFEEVFKALGLI